jgi:hypothetical protein
VTGVRKKNISRSGPPIGDTDTAAERQRLIAADAAFAKRLKRALARGKETPQGVLAQANEQLKYFQPWRINRGVQ